MQQNGQAEKTRLVIGNARGWERLAQMGETMELGTFELIHAARGNDEPCCYVVLEGLLVVKKLRPGRDSMAVGLRCRGALLFEHHALAEAHRKDLYFEATCPCTLSRIPRQQLRAGIESDPTLSAILADSLFTKLGASIDQFEDSHTNPAKKRLLSLLQELAQISEAAGGDDAWVRIDPRLSQQDLGDLLAVNRVTVAKALGTLKSEGAVSMDGRRILLARSALT